MRPVVPRINLAISPSPDRNSTEPAAWFCSETVRVLGKVNLREPSQERFASWAAWPNFASIDPAPGVICRFGMLGETISQEEICVMGRPRWRSGWRGCWSRRFQRARRPCHMPIAPMSKSVISGLNSDIDQAGWRRCWLDRWGRRHCRWRWRDRWGRIQCR